MKMKLWILKNTNSPSFDEMDSCVVAAKTEEEARVIASENAWGEDKYTWLSNILSTCEELKPTKSGMIISDVWEA